ncbi:MAG TPA: trypsin-like peptidase domain-containing protein [Thermoanaerobaculia bacterium]|nr:trypsin-like peptidase domain-containing protein [Thermoanaerobaculia bacterium]
MITLVTGLVTQGLIPLPAFMNAYDEHRSVSRQSPQFATLAVTAGGELQAIPAAVERARQDQFFVALWTALLERSQGALFGNLVVKRITDALTSQAAGTMQQVLKGAGFRRVETFPALMRAARATALVVVDGPQGRGYATGFLVGPDLLLTAAHAVAPLIENGQAKLDSSDRISIEFFNQLESPGVWPVKVRAQKDWLETMSLWHGIPPQLEAEDPGISPSRLDFALIRLARHVGLDLGYLDIRNPPAPNTTEILTIIGYPGGNNCLSDDDQILSYNAATFRVRHATNTGRRHVGQSVPQPEWGCDRDSRRCRFGRAALQPGHPPPACARLPDPERCRSARIGAVASLGAVGRRRAPRLDRGR